VVGDGERGEPEPDRFLGQLFGVARTVEEREVRVAVQLGVRTVGIVNGSAPSAGRTTLSNRCS